MKEAMEIMPQMLEYGIINANVLHLLKGLICQVNMDKGRNLSVFRVKAICFTYSTSREWAAITFQALLLYSYLPL